MNRRDEIPEFMLIHSAARACRARKSAQLGADSESAASLATAPEPDELQDRFTTAAASNNSLLSEVQSDSINEPASESSEAAQHATASDAASKFDEEQAERVLRRGRELSDVQIELDRVNKLYKRKSPLVRPPKRQGTMADHVLLFNFMPDSLYRESRAADTYFRVLAMTIAMVMQIRDANEFEALCMSSSKRKSSVAIDGASSQDQPEETDAEAEAGVQYNGLVRHQAKLRIHAVPFPTDPNNNDTGLAVSGDRLLFHFQILVENIGDAAVQLLGRYHEVKGAWDTIHVGSRAEPRGHKTDGVILMPGAAVIEQQYAVMEGSEGTMKGGFLVCPSLLVCVRESRVSMQLFCLASTFRLCYTSVGS